MILRCDRPRRNNRSRVCDGMIGAAPEGAVILRELRRFDEAGPDAYAMDCRRCGRIYEVSLPERLTRAA